VADLALQLQADFLPQDDLDQLLVEGHWAPVLRRLMTGENLLLEGCRGEGKTMLMRAAVARMSRDARTGGRVLGIHTTFKRYLATLPPPGTEGGDELGNFKAWVNARILGAAKEQVQQTCGEVPLEKVAALARVDWNAIIGILETTYRAHTEIRSAVVAAGLSETEFQSLQGYTYTVEILQEVRRVVGVDLLVLLLDDAAHALDTRAQGAFFTLVKSLYAEGLAFKIAVYPAVTRYGLDFSYGHDAVVVGLGQIPSPSIMDSYADLLRRRLRLSAPDDPSSELISVLLDQHSDWVRLLVYCSNANPRGVLKAISQMLTQLGPRTAREVKYEDVRNALNYVIDRHLDNMVPGIVKDLEPRLLAAAQHLLEEFRDKFRGTPGPVQAGQSRMFLALTNSMQIPYLCTAGVRLLVAANSLTPHGPVRLGKRENATAFLIHPGYVFRDNVLAAGASSTVSPQRWLDHFDQMSPRIHVDIGKTASLWEEVRDEAMLEPSGWCANGHPMKETSSTCEECGARAQAKGPAEVLLEKDVAKLDLSEAIIERLRQGGFRTIREVFEATPEELDRLPYVGESRVRKIQHAVSAAVDEFFAG
jgi:hypothetical protein